MLSIRSMITTMQGLYHDGPQSHEFIPGIHITQIRNPTKEGDSKSDVFSVSPPMLQRMANFQFLRVMFSLNFYIIHCKFHHCTFGGSA